jgi:hypothetical protein
MHATQPRMSQRPPPVVGLQQLLPGIAHGRRISAAEPAPLGDMAVFLGAEVFIVITVGPLQQSGAWTVMLGRGGACNAMQLW